MGSHQAMCFECLEREIKDDLSSDRLLFLHGVSDSALPFGSSAFLQVNLGGSKGEQSTSDDAAQFILERVSLAKQFDDFPSSNVSTSIDKDWDDGTAAKLSCSPDSSEYQVKDASGSMNQTLSLNFSGMDPKLLVNGHEDNSSKSESDDLVRKITILAPSVHIGTGCFSEFENIASTYVSGAVEDHIVTSLKLLVEGNPPGQHAAEFLNLVGVPSFDVNSIPKSVRHPNIIPALGMLRSDGHGSFLYPKSPYTLQNILHYSPDVLKSEWSINFLIYQIVSALSYLHNLGIVHGDVCPSNIMLTDSCWAWLKIHDNHLLRCSIFSEGSPISSSVTCFYMENCPSRSFYTDINLSTPIDWQYDFKRWWAGELSNYDYLLVLNRLAGRRWGDHTFHTVMPWVIDFSVKPDENSDAGWRDLQKSKWHLAKGDEQLDFTYATSEVPHHVSDECLSELAVCSYKARRLPLNILRSAVRSVYEPNEYPSSMQRLYQWTPDECIPEFYSDPRIFSSVHPEMTDLAIPSWAATPEEFISLHRAALESERVSQQIHHWIDITFGYKLSGHASITAKNVMLPTNDPSLPKSTGRRQLFTKPHPKRRGSMQCLKEAQISLSKLGNLSRDSNVKSELSTLSDANIFLPVTHYLQELEEAASFCEHARNLCPIYSHKDKISPGPSCSKLPLVEESETAPSLSLSTDCTASGISLQRLLEYLEADDNTMVGYQESLRWKQSLSLKNCSKEFAEDIFSVGCILAELYLKRPLFDPVSFTAYVETGMKPEILSKLPPHVAFVVECCIERDWMRRPSANCFLESQFFHSSIRSAYLFLAPLNLLAKSGNLLQYAAKVAIAGSLKAMGSFAVEMCAPYCVPFIFKNLSDDESESAICLLKEFLKYLKPEGIKGLILPAIQKILQAPEYSHLKVSILQESFVQELWKRVGKQVYLAKMHPLVISNLCNSPKIIPASAASVLLICLSEELGVPIALNQTILPLMCSFGRGLCGDGIESLVRIGGLLGENFIIKHLLPSLKSFVMSCIHLSATSKPEPLQSWNSLALVDSFAALDGLLGILPRDVVLKEVVLDQVCVHTKVLMQTHLDLFVLQVVAKGLIMICQLIGPDSTVLHVLPQMKDLFNELGFSKETMEKTHSCIKSSKKLDEGISLVSRMDLVCLLYPFFASLVGIEKLRQCCATWLLLEHYLQHFHNWKWEFVGNTSSSLTGSVGMEKLKFDKLPATDYSKLLLDGAGWSMPQSHAPNGSILLRNYKKVNFRQSAAAKDKQNSSFRNVDPWFWFPSDAATWDGPDFLGRNSVTREEHPWKVKASILYSARAHPGALRSLAVSHDECVVFTGGVGPGSKGTVQKWELVGVNCVSGYYGHEEIVNDICILSVSGRVASCDGTIHIWNGQTGKLIAAYAEPNLLHHTTIASNVSRVPNDHANITSAVLSEGILSSAFNGNLYTCMHFLESDDLLIAGMGNGSIRFIDVAQDRKLHLWKSDALNFSLSSLVSAICSWNSVNQTGQPVRNQSLIATGLSSGHCRLLDRRSGDVIAFWQAHDSYITKLAGAEDHMLVSSSLDKTLRVWDLRRSMSSQSNVFRGHLDGISSFAVWGKDVISISRSSIGISSLSRSELGPMQISPQKLYSADRGMKNLSLLTTISILPFSRLFLVGTEDGYLKICC